MLAGIITGVLMVLFVAGWIWVWNPRHKANFDAAARMPLESDEENIR
jgi:cytochrome c oxidase cbb3-type subunit 4